MKNNGSPVPEFETDEDRSYFLIRLLVHADAAKEETPVEISDQSQETTQKKTQEKIMGFMKEKPTITGRELAECLGMTSDGVKYHLNQLRAKGCIQHVGSTKAGHWEVLK